MGKNWFNDYLREQLKDEDFANEYARSKEELWKEMREEILSYNNLNKSAIMKVYVIDRLETHWDQYSAVTVCAENETEARIISSELDLHFGDPNYSIIEEIDLTKKGIILADFLNG